uniref:Uncharacterized protein n=1 Tax=Timema douglasi TaxID=61478 RepID=A0A7R8VCV3_TIMDO|nr:unnamed protein product [Timema douglasi]
MLLTGVLVSSRARRLRTGEFEARISFGDLMKDTDCDEFTLSQFLERQRILLHGNEARAFKHIPKMAEPETIFVKSSQVLVCCGPGFDDERGADQRLVSVEIVQATGEDLLVCASAPLHGEKPGPSLVHTGEWNGEPTKVLQHSSELATKARAFPRFTQCRYFDEPSNDGVRICFNNVIRLKGYLPITYLSLVTATWMFVVGGSSRWVQRPDWFRHQRVARNIYFLPTVGAWVTIEKPIRILYQYIVWKVMASIADILEGETTLLPEVKIKSKELAQFSPMKTRDRLLGPSKRDSIKCIPELGPARRIVQSPDTPRCLTARGRAI